MYKFIILLPLISSVITGLLNRSIRPALANFLTIFSMLVSTIISLIAFFKVNKTGTAIHQKLFSFISFNDLNVSWSIYIDQLSAIMLLVITSISTIVHIYSVGYMASDKAKSRFMSYLSLFTFFMLVLVLSDNFIQLFVGWEGVGLCSYLLIGFYYLKDSANAASIKAFIVNRVGDFALILGILLIYFYFGSFDYQVIFKAIFAFEDKNISFFYCNLPVLELICLLLFFGCIGKSAQIGLHVWLPDAMEGPTPVSALIHAATMVTAGVFLLARCSYMFEFAPLTKNFITIIGSVTCLFASLIAITQKDIKKIIAYSTCSQLGYMFIAAGVGSYQAGIFHLYTHAFYKALLFLCAGAVIHGVHQQDINKMGNLRKYMPITYILFLIGSLAIMGIYPFAGFYSKDLVLVSAYLAETKTGDFAFRMGVLAAFCTAIYSMKLFIKIFHGEQQFKTKKTSLEDDKILIYPLFYLAIGAVISGYIGYAILDMKTPVQGFFKQSIYFKTYEVGEHAHILIELLPLIVSIAGIIVGYIIYSTNISKNIAKSFGPFYNLIANKFYFDEIYNAIFVKTSDYIASILKCFDKKVIDFIGPGLSSHISLFLSNRIARIHNGIINNYVVLMIASVAFVLTYLIFKLAF